MIGAGLALVLAAAPPVTLAVDPCAEVSAEEVRRIVALELAATRVSIQSLDGSVTCDGDALTFDVVDSITGKTLQRKVALASAAPNARARLLALAMVEAVEASWDEVLYAPVPPAPVEPPAPAPAPLPNPPMVVAEAPKPTAPPPPERPRYQLSVIGTSRALFDSPLWQWGGGARFVHAPFRYFGWAAELAGEYGEFATKLGAVQLSSGGGAAEAFAQLPVGLFTFQLAAGVRGGVVTARGIPSVPFVVAKELTGPWAGPYAALSANAGFEWFTVTGRVEAGAMAVGVPAHVDVVNTGMTGPWVGLSIAIGVRS